MTFAVQTKPHADKSAAWDNIGKMFWELGRKTAKPSQAEIDIFLDSAPGKRLCIVGASTRDLAVAALERGFNVTVLDFSTVMCRDLRAELGDADLSIEQGDIQHPPQHLVDAGFDLVVSDRLLNRFDLVHAQACLAGHRDLLSVGGEARLSVKLGFYAIDPQLIAEAERQGIGPQVYDAAERTIDYSQARSVLEAVPISHGDIPRSALIEWYVGRGREARFERDQLDAMIWTAAGQGIGVVPTRDFPDAPDTVLVSLQRAA